MGFFRLVALVSAAVPALALAQPRYAITDLGALGSNNYSQAFGISPSGSAVVGRAIGENTTKWPAFVWQAGTGMVAQGSLAGYSYYAGYGVNDDGVSVGVAAVTQQGGSPVPVMWSQGTATALAMPGGRTAGRAFGINDAGIAVGSVGSGSTEQAAIFDTVTHQSTLITARTADASRAYMQTAFGISDTGLVVGVGVDLGSRNVALLYDTASGTMTQIGVPAAPGATTSLGFDISSNGQYAVGSFGIQGQPFIVTIGSAATAVALPPGTSSGTLRGVNDHGWAVGIASSLYSNPFLVAEGQTWLINDVVQNAAGWNFLTTTSAAALGIADNGNIVGTAQFNGIEHAFLLTPVPEPGSSALMLAGLLGLGYLARRRAAQP